MGILSGLTNLVSKTFSTQTKLNVVNTTNKILAGLTSPIQSILNPKKARQETAQKGALKLVGEGVENTLAVLAPFTAGGKSLITKAAVKSVSTVKGAVLAIAGTGAVAGGLSTEAGRNLISNLPTPTDIFVKSKDFTETVGEVIGGEKKLTDVTPEDILKGTAILGAGAAAAAGAKYLYDKAQDRKEANANDNSPVFSNVSQDLPTGNSNSTLPTSEDMPVLRETTSIDVGTKKRKKYKKKAPQNNTIRNNIMINNNINSTKQQTKKYLKARVF